MNILLPIEWKRVNLLTEQDPNLFGEALRHYCFTGNCMQTGCYSTFNLVSWLIKVTSGKIYNEAKTYIKPEFPKALNVYHSQLKEKNRWIEGLQICERYEIVCAWEWCGDGTLYFRFNDRKVINTDCKKSYTWEFVQ